MQDTPSTLHITREMVAPDGTYTGPDVSDWQGHIRIAADLGTVRFPGALRATLSITADAGSGIEAGDGIEAGFSLTAKWVSARLRIFVGLCMWRLPSPDECEVRAELRGGTIAHGTLVAPATAEG
jgi:hypothetical protein